jgi:uncharacterized protein
VNVWLLDVNFLVARFWEPHIFHREARAWTAKHEQEGWATCPITQAGFARTISNPGFSPNAPSPAEAIFWLGETLRQNASHEFWDDDVPLSALSASIRRCLRGPKQVTGAYLLTLAMHRKGTLVTFDAGMHALAPKGSAEHDALVILRP